MRKIAQKFSIGIFAVKNRLLFWLMPRLAHSATRVATLRSRKILKKDSVKNILIDLNVLTHATIFKTAWINTGPKIWGGQEIQTGYAARVPTYESDAKSAVYKSVLYLPGVSELHKDGFVKIWTSGELEDERFRQPAGRFRGYGIYDYNIFQDLRFDPIDEYVSKIIVGGFGDPTDPKREQRDRLRSCTDPLYIDILKALGSEKHSQDAYHIYCAERNNCFCFLTMDFRLINIINSQKHNKTLSKLNTKILSPEQFGKIFDIKPVIPLVFLYTQASYPVRS